MSFQPDDLILNDCYRIEAQVGHGAFAEVYRTTHLSLNALRALKVLRRDAPGLGSTEYSDYRQRFQLEAQLGAQLDHPNVIRIYDFQPLNETLVLIMEYAPGGSLLELLQNQRQQQTPLPVAKAVQIGIDVAQGLAALHTLDVVHRDLKPSNILFDAQGRAKVADLGLAQIAHGPSMRSQLSRPLPHPGTPAYMSPEQRATGDYLTSASDIFTLGVVLFEMLTGRVYRNLPAGTRARALRADVPAWLDDVLARMLDEDPKVRPWDGAAAAACLTASEKPSAPALVIPVTPVEAQPAPAPQRAAPPTQAAPVPMPVRQPTPAGSAVGTPKSAPQSTAERKPFPVWVGVLLGVMGLAGLIWGLSQGGAGATPTPERTVEAIMVTQEMVRVITATPSPEPETVQTAEATETLTTVSVIHTLGDTWTRPADGMVMVYVPAGEFQMGSTEGYDAEEPVHAVVLNGFWLDRTEVTNAQYQKCVTAGDCEVSGYASNSDYNGVAQPVVGVSWHDAVAYCKWAEARLPTEAEWEYAARGPEGLIYPWGNTWDCARGNFNTDCGSDSYALTAPVGSFPEGTSWVGALDLAGNVWEWVADWYGSYSSGRQVNPAGPQSGTARVLRGGSWGSSENYARCANRLWYTPTGTGNGYRGFRCGVSLPRVTVRLTPARTPVQTPSSTFALTATFISTATATPTSTATPSQSPTVTPTPRRELLYATVQLDGIANATWDHFQSPPQGEVALNEVPFNLASRIFKSQAASAPSNTYPTEATVYPQIDRAQQVSLLLTAGNAFTRYNGKRVGEVRVTCEGIETPIASLELGRNLREWHAVGEVVTSAPEAQSVWRGTLASFPDLVGHIDMLTLTLPVACQQGTLEALTIRDLSTETVGSQDPALNLIGLTVAYYP